MYTVYAQYTWDHLRVKQMVLVTYLCGELISRLVHSEETVWSTLSNHPSSNNNTNAGEASSHVSANCEVKRR